MKYPFVAQHDERDCGAACLSMICEFYGLKMPLIKFIEAIKVDASGSNMLGITTGAKLFGLEAEALKGDENEFMQAVLDKEFKLPIIARIITGEGFEHYVVIYRISKNHVIIGDPCDKVRKWKIEDFFQVWTGHIVAFKVTEQFQKRNERIKSALKFTELITNQKKLIGSLFFISIITTILSLVVALLFGYVVFYTVYGNDNDSAYEEIVEEEYDNDSNEEEHEHDDGSEKDYIYEVMRLFLSEKTIDNITIQTDQIFNSTFKTFLIILLAYIVQMGLFLLRCYLVSTLCKRIDIPLMRKYYDHLIDLPIESINVRKTGELLSRFSDTSNIRNAISTTTITLLLDTLIILFGGIILFKINQTLFFISWISIIVYIIVVVLFLNPTKRVNKKIMEANAQLTDYLKESIIGVETVKSNRYENIVKSKTHNLFNLFVNSAFKGMMISGTQDVLVGTIANISVIFLLWAGSKFVFSGTLTIGTLFTFYYIFSYFINPVQNLVELQPTIQSAIVAADRLNDILDAEPENNTQDNIDSMFDDIQYDNVDFRYGNRERVLKQISLRIPKGSKIAFVGESGCGKTTLIKLLMAFYMPEHGQITVGDKEFSKYSPQSIRQRISYISQNIFLFSDSVYNNLRMGNEDVTDEEIKNVCQQCGIDDFICSLPMGYDTILEENGNDLSGGQKQRLAIARALLRKPDVLIMDEATSNLDTITENSIKAMIENFSDKMTCIIIAHRLNTIRNCDYIYVMDKGQVAEEGTHDKLLNRNGLYSKFVNQ